LKIVKNTRQEFWFQSRKPDIGKGALQLQTYPARVEG